MTRWEYASVEWIWDQNSLRVDLPGGETQSETGSYAELNALLNRMGAEGWEAVSSAPSANWIFWTLKRPRS